MLNSRRAHARKLFLRAQDATTLAEWNQWTHIDAFADDLEREGYAWASAVRYIRAAAHLGCFVQRRGGVLADIDGRTLHAFVGHLRRCRCPHFRRAKIAFHARFGVKLFHQRSEEHT